MKIGLFTETYLPRVNGVATHVKTLKEGFEKNGHEVLVVTADTETWEYFVEDGILHCPSAEIKRFYGNGVGLPKLTKDWLINHGYEFDVVHVHTEFSMGLAGVKIAKKQDIPLIYTMHTMWEQYLHYVAPEKMIPMVKKAERAYIKKFLKRADEIIGPSQRVQLYLDKCGVDRKVNVVPNAVELDDFQKDKINTDRIKELKNKYSIAEDDFVIAFCGRLGQEKSVDVLIDNFAYTYQDDKHMKLLIVGGGPMREELEKQAGEKGILDHVVFTGSVAHENIPELYACADVFSTASKTEVNSISMLEAMAMELPVIHIVDENNPGQVSEGVNGYLYRTADEFKAIIDRLYENPEKLKKLKASTKNSVNYAKEDELAEHVEQIYLKAIEARKNRIIVP